MKELLPVMMKEGIPIPPSTFDYVPLPSDVAQEWKQMAQANIPQMRQQLQQQGEQLQAMSQQLQALSQENQGLKADRTVEAAKVAVKHADSQQRNALKDKQIDTQAMVEMITKHIDARIETLRMGMEAHSHHAALKSDERIAEKAAAAKPAAKAA